MRKLRPAEHPLRQFRARIKSSRELIAARVGGLTPSPTRSSSHHERPV
jgi:hypothetical protein